MGVSEDRTSGRMGVCRDLGESLGGQRLGPRLLPP